MLSLSGIFYLQVSFYTCNCIFLALFLYFLDCQSPLRKYIQIATLNFVQKHDRWNIANNCVGFLRSLLCWSDKHCSIESPLLLKLVPMWNSNSYTSSEFLSSPKRPQDTTEIQALCLPNEGALKSDPHATKVEQQNNFITHENTSPSS